MLEFGGTQIAFEALKSGEINIYPEDTGAAYTSIFKKTEVLPSDETYSFVNRSFIDSQVEVKGKMRYQLFCEAYSQIYYSNDLEELIKIYEELESSKVIYEVPQRYDNIIKLRTVVSDEVEIDKILNE